VHVVVDDMHVVGSASARHPATRLEGDPRARVSLSSALLSAARSYWAIGCLWGETDASSLLAKCRPRQIAMLYGRWRCRRSRSRVMIASWRLPAPV
jgi:hypothetical protein